MEVRAPDSNGNPIVYRFHDHLGIGLKRAEDCSFGVSKLGMGEGSEQTQMSVLSKQVEMKRSTEGAVQEKVVT